MKRGLILRHECGNKKGAQGTQEGKGNDMIGLNRVKLARMKDGYDT